MPKIDILITGIGGQGIIMASDVLAQAGMLDGYDVKKTDSIGMAQRGGSVVSHIRLGEKVYSPLISPGEADILFAMEKLEAARTSDFLRNGGMALLSRYSAPPVSLIGGRYKYPSDEVILNCLHRRTERVYLIDGLAKVAGLGNIKTLNVFLLGALSGLLPLSREAWHASLKTTLPEKILNINLEAFDLGIQEIAGGSLK
ncbi:MAG: indolepyruvate oxidoreductase subunit beta [Dehalococcoidaceae bacterium]|nr:indolepyruvate oxidoreductase subunit beta [Dehalococcoidaceae bacterium]